MKIKYFENCIPYNKNSIYDYNDDYTINLSTLFFVHNIPKSFFNTIYEKPFDFKSIINPEELIKIHYDGNFHFLTQPDFEKLAEAFGYSIKGQTTIHKDNLERITKQYIEVINKVLNDIDKFLNKRSNFLKLKDLSIISNFSMENEENLRELLIDINETLNLTTVVFPDYYYKEYQNYNGENKKDFAKYNGMLRLQFFYNYNSLKSFLDRLIFQDNEYYHYHHNLEHSQITLNRLNESLKTNKNNSDIKNRIKKINEENEKYYEILDKINNNPFYNKGNLAILSLSLNEYIKQEEAIYKFFTKVIENNLETVEKEDFNLIPGESLNLRNIKKSLNSLYLDIENRNINDVNEFNEKVDNIRSYYEIILEKRKVFDRKN